MYTDDILEKHLTKLKESNNSKNKLLHYKKAVKRLDELESEYNSLSKALEKPPAKKSTSSKTKIRQKYDNTPISIEKIIKELSKIMDEIETNKDDMSQVINSYIQYKLLLDDLDTETSKMKNEIASIGLNKNKITITKLDPDNIL